MDAFIGMIMPVAWSQNFTNVQGWAVCDGRSLPVAGNSALYSLIGNIYGGNQAAFNLPDLRGRVIVGSGIGPGLSPYAIGQKGGNETTTLSSQNLPMHNHAVIIRNPKAQVTGNINATLNVNSSASGTANPSGNFIGLLQSSGGETLFASNSNATMNSGAISVQSKLEVDLGSSGLNTATTGAGFPFDNKQPYLSLTYIICLQGLYPTQQ